MLPKSKKWLAAEWERFMKKLLDEYLLSIYWCDDLVKWSGEAGDMVQSSISVWSADSRWGRHRHVAK